MIEKPYFIEIGASDFDTLLPLARNGWRGVVVEPIPFYATKLREIIEHEHLDVIVIEAAVTTFNGTAEMYECLERSEQWTRGISHLKEQSGTRLLELSANQHLSRKIIEVEAITLHSLLEDMALIFRAPIDFLKIDIEGHELDVLKNHVWSCRPKMIKIEHKHCDDQKMKGILESDGYKVWVEADDIYAIR